MPRVAVRVRLRNCSRRPLIGGILAGAAGYFLMASFNNPFLFIQVSVVVFTAIGFGLGLRPDGAPEASPRPAADTGASDPG